MEAKIVKLVDAALNKVYEVRDIIVEYFGEDLVDPHLYIEDYCTLVKDYFNSKAVADIVGKVVDTDEQGNHYVRPDKSIGFDFPLSIYNEWKAKNALDFILSEHFTEDMIGWFSNCASRVIENNYGAFYIVIKFPKVKVTNENDKYVTIKDLFARISILINGCFSRNIQLVRTTFTKDQWESDYAHSHLPGIGLEWQTPCFGTGPIVSTQDNLYSNYSPELWGLLCYELDKYVRVESLAGIPYRRLESIGGRVRASAFINNARRGLIPRRYEVSNMINKFIKYYIKREDIPIQFVNNHYELGANEIQYWIHISKVFIDWLNKRYVRTGRTNRRFNLDSMMGKYIVDGYNVYLPRGSSRTRSIENAPVGTTVISFKGEPVKFTIEEEEENENTGNEIYLLQQDIVSYILSYVLKTINYYEGRKEKEEVGLSEKCYFI